MNLRLFLTNLRFSRIGMASWGVLLFLFGLWVVNLYGVYSKLIGAEVYQGMPEQLKAAVGISGTGPESLFSESGISINAYLTAEFLSWWPITIGIYAVIFCAGIIAKEVDKGTIELLLSQPLRRYQVLMSKYAVFLLGLFAIALASFIGMVFGFATIEAKANYANIVLAFVQGFLLVAAIGSYSTLFSCFFLDPRKSMAVSGFLTAALYILNFIAPSLGSFEWLKRLSLFYYYQAFPILESARMNWAGIGIYLGIALGCIAVGIAVFERRDILAE